MRVYAARRREFDATVRHISNTDDAVRALFKALPLAAHGWNPVTTIIRHISNTQDGVTVHVRRA